MRTQEAILILQRLDRSNAKIIPIEPNDGCPLTPERILRDKSGNVIIKYVNRLQYINWLCKAYSLYPKGTSINAIHRSLKGI